MIGTNRNGRPLDTEEIAAILSYGDIHGDSAAARQFGLSLRTVQRYRRKLKEGLDPALSQAVVKTRQTVAQKYGDLMDEVFELGLIALKARIQTACDNPAPIEDRALIGAIKIIGDQRTVRDFLAEDEGEDEFGTSDDREAEEAAGAVPRTSASEASTTTRTGSGSVH
jgi:hypothetical protein